MRSFAVVAIYKPGQKMTRTAYKHGRIEMKSDVNAPRHAASKALTKYCSSKKISGVCTLVVVVQETTAGSEKKMYAYKGKRRLYTNKEKKNNSAMDKNGVMDMDGTPVTFRFAPNKMEAVPVPSYVHAFSK